jgi:hypothetical protein
MARYAVKRDGSTAFDFVLFALAPRELVSSPG